jgi:hypothetical protein
MTAPQDGYYVGHREAREVARYVTAMTAQWEEMAAAAHLKILAHFLGMAKAEADRLVHHRFRAAWNY